MSPQQTSKPERRPRGGVGLVGMIGGSVALCILVGLGLGLLLDRVTHKAPLFLIAGVVLGFIASFYLAYRVAMGELGE